MYSYVYNYCLTGKATKMQQQLAPVFLSHAYGSTKVNM